MLTKTPIVTLAMLAWWTSSATASVMTVLEPGQGWVSTIANNGTAAGYRTELADFFVWSPTGGHMHIGGVSPEAGSAGQAAIDAQGMVVCGTDLNPATGKFEAARYDIQSGSWTLLGGLQGSCDSSVSSGWGMSGDGTRLVGLGWDGCSAFATYWDGTSPGVSLGTTSPGQPTRANATNHDGSVIVGWQDGNGRQGAVWVDGQQQLITSNGNPADEASCVSSDGRWVAGMGVGPLWGVGDTWVWDTHTQTSQTIINLPDGERFMAAGGVGPNGDMVVGGTWGFGVPASYGQAWIWRDGQGTQLLSSYLDEIGVTVPPGLTLAFASALSPDGSWMGGWGHFGSPGNTVSWFVELPQHPSCPADLDGSGAVDVNDVLQLIACWGQSCGDVTGDGQTTADDVLAVLSAWGDC